ncbi:MAG: 5'/3'-nucleotidase SurE [Bacteroidales bacterium]|nr:5'/3'-nucleotidase SurE [Bacteroidales bacterium]
MRPLFLITNDDGYNAKGLEALVSVALDLGDVIVMAPVANASGQAHSFTATRPLRINTISEAEGLSIYACDGTPVDCVKVCEQFFCPRRPTMVLSGINHGSNSSINVLYSGTMGAVLEASVAGFDAIGFSLLDHSADADFAPALPFIRKIIESVLEKGLPPRVSLNVNFPVPEDGIIKGMRVCRQSEARWLESYQRRIDPHGNPYYWIAGTFECNDKADDSDQWALENGFVSIVPTTTDFTAYNSIDICKNIIF